MAEAERPSLTVWGTDCAITWETATPEVREQFALQRLYWFFRMSEIGGPDGSELDQEVVDQAREAAVWFGPIFQARAQRASASSVQRGADHDDDEGGLG